MRFVRQLRLRSKLILISLLTSAAALLLASAGFIANELQTFKDELNSRVASAAQMIGYNSASALSFNDAASAEETMEGLSAEPRIRTACIFDRDGAVFAVYPKDRPATDFHRGLITGPSERFVDGHLEVVRPIAVDGEVVGHIFIRAGLDSMNERLVRYAQIVLVVLVAALLVAYLIASRLQRLISAPVSDLAAIASRVATHRDYSVRAPPAGDDEIGRLVAGFNEMLSQIQSRDEALAAARDNLEKRVEERTAELARENVERRRAEEARQASERFLHSLVENLPVFIFRKDAGGRMTFANTRFLERVGRKAEDVIGRTTAELLPAEDAAKQERNDRQVMETGRTYEATEEITSGEGKKSFIHVIKVPVFDQNGRCAGIQGMFLDISERKAAEDKLAETHQKLLDASRQAGMAEVATGVLHNVGNVLNSVNVSATLVADHIRHTKALNLGKLAALFAQNKDNLAEYLTRDPRGQMIPGYLATLAEMVADENKTVVLELENLRKNVEHIKDIVAMQQAYARTSGMIETVAVVDMVEDAIRINSGSLARHDVDLVREYQQRPVLTTDKHKVIQILINLIRNAKYACDESGRVDKRIILRTTRDDRFVRIAVIDNGVGIPPANLMRIFNHGFTTRAHGHGFGLHSGALAAKEIGGALTVHSEGAGHGATFVLELPYKPETASHATAF
jgi:PAS domain S-box-containing protein